MESMLRTMIVLAATLVGSGTLSFGQSSTTCEDAKVQYRAPTRNIEQKIRLTAGAKPPSALKSTQSGKSPQGTRWFDEIDPDYTSTGQPWNTTLYVHLAASSGPVLKIDFLDHGNTFTARWINEKLIFAQVWWGRFASSDLIIDVDRGKVIYHELANYAQLGEPCDPNE